jgi:hypothetical protein
MSGNIMVKVSKDLIESIRKADPIHFKEIPTTYVVDTALRELLAHSRMRDKTVDLVGEQKAKQQ